MKRVGVVCCTCKVWNERDMAEWPCLPDLGSGVGEKIAFLYILSASRYTVTLRDEQQNA